MYDAINSMTERLVWGALQRHFTLLMDDNFSLLRFPQRLQIFMSFWAGESCQKCDYGQRIINIAHSGLVLKKHFQLCRNDAASLLSWPFFINKNNVCVYGVVLTCLLQINYGHWRTKNTSAGSCISSLITGENQTSLIYRLIICRQTSTMIVCPQRHLHWFPTTVHSYSLVPCSHVRGIWACILPAVQKA